MKISPIGYTPSFNANCRKVSAGNGYATNTYLLRHDFDWEGFSRFLAEKFRNTPLVNVINHACSSGHETYSLVAKIISDFGIKGAEKFDIIIARDLDRQNIEMAKFQDLELEMELKDGRIEKYIPDYYNYFDIYQTSQNGVIKHWAHPKEILKNKINFATGNILQDIDNIPEKNTVLLCRNFWPYLNENQRTILLNKISNKFKDDTSVIAIGTFDRVSANLNQLLESKGFKQTCLRNVYTRSGF